MDIPFTEINVAWLKKYELWMKGNDKDELALYDEQTREVKLNTLKIKHFRYKFEAVDNVYKNGMSIREAYIRAGYDVSIAQHYEQVITNYLYEMNNTPRFEVLYEEYLPSLLFKMESYRTQGIQLH